MSTFIDANIFLAALGSDEERSRIAAAVIDEDSNVTSTAVLLEVLSVATRRFRLDYTDAEAAVRDILERVELVDVPVDRLFEGVSIARTNRLDLSMIDAVHVASAIHKGCERLLSEDMGHNAWYGGDVGEVLVLNPFKPDEPPPRARKAARSRPRARANGG